MGRRDGIHATGTSAIGDINLSGCFLLTDRTMMDVCKSCPLLTRLNIANCTRLTDAALHALELCTRLKACHLGGLLRVTDTGFILEESELNSFVKDLDVDMGVHKTWRTGQWLGLRRCSSLVSLQLSKLPHLTTRGVEAMARVIL
jgi:hypothetical protein